MYYYNRYERKKYVDRHIHNDLFILPFFINSAENYTIKKRQGKTSSREEGWPKQERKLKIRERLELKPLVEITERTQLKWYRHTGFM